MTTTKKKPTKKTKGRKVYGFLCPTELHDRAEAVAKKRGFGDKSDIAREGVIAFLEKEETRLGLVGAK